MFVRRSAGYVNNSAYDAPRSTPGYRVVWRNHVEFFSSKTVVIYLDLSASKDP